MKKNFNLLSRAGIAAGLALSLGACAGRTTVHVEKRRGPTSSQLAIALAVKPFARHMVRETVRLAESRNHYFQIDSMIDQGDVTTLMLGLRTEVGEADVITANFLDHDGGLTTSSLIDIDVKSGQLQPNTNSISGYDYHIFSPSYDYANKRQWAVETSGFVPGPKGTERYVQIQDTVNNLPKKMTASNAAEVLASNVNLIFNTVVQEAVQDSKNPIQGHVLVDHVS